MVIWGQKLRQTKVLPGEPLGAAGGFGDAGVAREPRRAATQHALNSKLFLFPGLVCYQFITFIFNNLWEFPVAAELSWGFVQPSCLAVPSGEQRESAPERSDPVLPPAPALGSCFREGNTHFSRETHGLNLDWDNCSFSASSSSCLSPFCNIEEKVEGKRKGYTQHTYTCCDTLSVQQECDGMSVPLLAYP